MSDSNRQAVAAAARLLVGKVGTRVLTGPDGLLDSARIEALGKQFDELLNSGRQVVLVSSGAVGAGMGRMGLRTRPQELAHLQAVAAIGQSCLIEAYERVLRAKNRHAAQLLLVADDLRRIAGLKTEQIVGVLGYAPYDEVIHRDNLAVICRDAPQTDTSI